MMHGDLWLQQIFLGKKNAVMGQNFFLLQMLAIKRQKKLTQLKLSISKTLIGSVYQTSAKTKRNNKGNHLSFLLIRNKKLGDTMIVRREEEALCEVFAKEAAPPKFISMVINLRIRMKKGALVGKDFLNNSRPRRLSILWSRYVRKPRQRVSLITRRVPKNLMPSSKVLLYRLKT